ncbi:TetR/AcrR family transcriptional regulator [Salinispora arenicola]|uniref:TetR/AcrR family transcriptional regulator n=1 Tax=Salinispora arenicola TaxID=168697 RepID=UPI0003159641|nr:TetR/AcrR family transcriptional regulator C-terminal domain-containing protein [Salinispora arenicola]MCN0177825.1 TetR/AcrR family transcriptional regulator C-terminal domain-containing protein [Salinispora arenicola]
MPKPSSPPFHVGLTPARITDVAVDLTRESHLFGWSIRDLAGRLDVAPSVVYHHIGGKDRIARHVVERVLETLAPPPASPDWQTWFRELLNSIYPAVSAHPGVAKWLLMHGPPTIPSVIPVVDTGISVLQHAGFGDRAGLAYAALLNNAMLSVSIGDERLVHEDDGPRDHAALMEEFRLATADSPGVAVLTEVLITPFTEGDSVAARQREAYYRFVNDITIAGLAVMLTGA